VGAGFPLTSFPPTGTIRVIMNTQRLAAMYVCVTPMCLHTGSLTNTSFDGRAWVAKI
jgi:hypothetical protein